MHRERLEYQERSTETKPLPGTGLVAGLYYDPYPPRFAINAKRLLARGVPLLVRLHPGARYPMDDDHLMNRVDPEGHVVALIGFDEETDSVTVGDPWNPAFGGSARPVHDFPARELFGTRIVDSTKDLCAAAIPLPLTVTARPLGNSGIDIEAEMSLTLPTPLRCGAQAMEDLCATIHLPSGLELIGGEESTECGNLVVGETRKVRWSSRQVGPVGGEIHVAAAGIAIGDEPYAFRDAVGSTASLMVASQRESLGHAAGDLTQKATS